MPGVDDQPKLLILGGFPVAQVLLPRQGPVPRCNGSSVQPFSIPSRQRGGGNRRPERLPTSGIGWNRSLRNWIY